jgi:hypothetical protein
MQIEGEARDVKFFDRTRGRAFMHPGSVCFTVGRFASGWMVFTQMTEVRGAGAARAVRGRTAAVATGGLPRAAVGATGVLRHSAGGAATAAALRVPCGAPRPDVQAVCARGQHGARVRAAALRRLAGGRRGGRPAAHRRLGHLQGEARAGRAQAGGVQRPRSCTSLAYPSTAAYGTGGQAARSAPATAAFPFTSLACEGHGHTLWRFPARPASARRPPPRWAPWCGSCGRAWTPCWRPSWRTPQGRWAATRWWPWWSSCCPRTASEREE